MFAWLELFPPSEENNSSYEQSILCLRVLLRRFFFRGLGAGAHAAHVRWVDVVARDGARREDKRKRAVVRVYRTFVVHVLYCGARRPGAYERGFEIRNQQSAGDGAKVRPVAGRHKHTS